MPGAGGPPVFTADGFANSFANSFLNFAVHQDPNQKTDVTDGKPFWPEYVNKRPEEVIFGQTGDGENADIRVTDVDGQLLERCR